MPVSKTSPDPGIYFLADHLDAALAAGEDLIAETLPAAPDRAASSPDDVPAFIARLARHEAALIARVLQARRRAMELPRLDAPMRPVIQLIIAQSAGLLAIIEQFGDDAESRFATGGDPLAFLRSRGLVGAEAASLPRFDALQVTDAYKLAGTIELGPLLNMVSGALEALDIAYDLFRDEDDTAEAADGATIHAAAPAAEAAIAVDAADAEADEGEGDAAGSASADRAPAVLTPSSLAQALQDLQRARTH